MGFISEGSNQVLEFFVFIPLYVRKQLNRIKEYNN
jgi:hypothetical protein